MHELNLCFRQFVRDDGLFEPVGQVPGFELVLQRALGGGVKICHGRGSLECPEEFTGQAARSQ